MAAFEDVSYGRRSVRFPESRSLVLADVHVGRDATSDVELPMGEGDDLVDRLQERLETAPTDRVIVAGDFLHSFGSVPYGVPDTIDRIVSTVEAAGAQLTVVAGNHDRILEDVSDVAVTDSVPLEDGTLVHHGHELPETDADRYVIGHEHPAIAIEGDRHPCFLECRNQYRGAGVLVLPAFNRFAVGTVVNSMDAEDSMSPLLIDMDGCRPVVRTAEETLRFPGLGTLRSHL